ncbi:MAG: AMP-binding protein [Eubacterium sp.]|nr:AMP-binding protein [Eubacterium sp.]
MDVKNMTMVPKLKPIFEARKHTDFRDLLNYAAFAYKTDDAFKIKTGKDEHKNPMYRHVTFLDFKDEVNSFGAGMLKRGHLNKRIAIIGKNSYEWYMSYFAVLCGLGVVVPLDKGLPYEETENSLIKSRADVLLFDKMHLDLAEELKKNARTSVTEYYALEEIPGYTSVYDIIEEGRKELESGNEEFLSLPIDPDKMQILLFTSGTTSKAKAVMLSEHNILSNIYMLDRVEDVRHGDVNMAFLPYHHTFGSSGQTMMISRGVTTVFCDGLKYIQKNIVEYHVTVFVCVPLLIEAIYKRIQQGIDKQGKRKTFERGLKISRFLLKFHIDIRRRLFKEVLDQLGGKLRYIVSGASALDPEVETMFEAMGINVVQGYGMTEASPVIAGENPTHRRPGSIGHSMPDLDLIVIDQNEEGIGEMVCRGPNVMLGYYEDPEATAEILEDGWLHTGDLVSLDSDGYIYIRGRKKNVIVLKNGKNVYPEELEDLIDALPYITESMVYGQQRHKDGDSKDLTICARIVYDPEAVGEDAADTAALNAKVQHDIDAINETLPTYKQIHRFELTDQQMEKTTTGKIKRYAQK